MKRIEANDIVMDLYEEIKNSINVDLQLVRNTFSPIAGNNLQLSYLFAIDVFKNLQNGSFESSNNPICIINLCKSIGLAKYKKYSPLVQIPYAYYFIWNYENDKWHILNKKTKLISDSNLRSFELALRQISTD